MSVEELSMEELLENNPTVLAEMILQFQEEASEPRYLISAVYRFCVQLDGKSIEMDEVIPLRICSGKEAVARFIGQLTLEDDLGMAIWCMTGRHNSGPTFIRIHETDPHGKILGEDGHSDDGPLDCEPEHLTDVLDDFTC